MCKMMYTSTVITRKLRFTAFIQLLLFVMNFYFANGFKEKAYDQFCTIEDFQNCLQLLQTVGSGESDMALPVNEDELDRTCIDLKNGVICLDLHIRRCFSPEMQQVYTYVATDAKHFVRDLCDNHTVQREYLRHAKCYRNVTLDQNKCGLKYRNAVDITKEIEGKDVQSLDSESIMKRSCCALQEFVQCKNTYVMADCGERANMFMEKHLPKITNPIMDQHCSAYTYGPNACSLHNPQSSNTVNNYHTCAVLLTITLLLIQFCSNY